LKKRRKNLWDWSFSYRGGGEEEKEVEEMVVEKEEHA
jgi:hypothetical protein